MKEPPCTADYSAILHHELQVAMGCTEPIALAFCTAYANHVLGKFPERYEVYCSGNIIKNVKSVTIPNTGGLKGIEAAVAAGSVAGHPEKKLEVLNQLTAEQVGQISKELEKKNIKVFAIDSEHPLHIIVKVFHGDDSASVEVIDEHTSIGEVRKNGETLSSGERTQLNVEKVDECMSVHGILEFADTVDLAEVQAVLENQIELNDRITREGLSGEWGANVGSTLLSISDDARTRLKAVAAAGSDARMNGCALPVVINSGSGNQGITCSMPVVEYARQKNLGHEQLLRGLCVSNLVAVHIKNKIGRLSAYCGAVTAATGSAAAIAYLDGRPTAVIENTIINALGNISGMVCDGAKSSCAAKIASAVDCGLMSYDMASRGRVFKSGEGLVKEDVEETIKSVGRLGGQGMNSTDKEIIKIMLDEGKPE